MKVRFTIFNREELMVLENGFQKKTLKTNTSRKKKPILNHYINTLLNNLEQKQENLGR
jgi:hypothetical protein